MAMTPAERQRKSRARRRAEAEAAREAAAQAAREDLGRPGAPACTVRIPLAFHDGDDRLRSALACLAAFFRRPEGRDRLDDDDRWRIEAAVEAGATDEELVGEWLRMLLWTSPEVQQLFQEAFDEGVGDDVPDCRSLPDPSQPVTMNK